MFKDDFKAANNSIHADEALVNKVLALKNPENKIIPRNKKRFTPYIPAAAAAVIVLCAAAYSIPYLTKTHKDDGVLYTVVSETNSPNTDNAAAPSPLPQGGTEQSAATSDIPAISSKQEAAAEAADAQASTQNKAVSTPKPDTGPKPNKSAVNPASSAVPKHNSEQRSTEAVIQEPTENDELTYYLPTSQSRPEDNSIGVSIDLPDIYAQDADSADGEKSISVSAAYAPLAEQKEERVVLCLNEDPYAAARKGNMNGALGGGYSAALAAPAKYCAASWNYKDYFDYIGKQLKPTLPEDFKLIGHNAEEITDEAFLKETFDMALDETGKPVFDSKSFVFNGTTDRYISIQTTKNTNTAMTYLKDSKLSQSKIGSTDCVLIGTTEDCRCYMICNETAYIINSNGLTEEELKALLLSIAYDS